MTGPGVWGGRGWVPGGALVSNRDEVEGIRRRKESAKPAALAPEVVKLVKHVAAWMAPGV